MFFYCFLTYLLFTSCLAAEESVKYALLGTSCFFTPDFSGKPDLIMWKHNQNKVVEFDVNKEEVYGSYKGRVTLDWKTAELEITELRFEDSGDYELELHINYNLHTSQFKLEVIDKVVKPTISCSMNKNSSSSDSKVTATLLCSADPRKPESLMSLKWKSQGLFHHGSKLQITLGDEHDEVEYSCSVSNPLSSETVSFTAKECYNDQSSPVPLIVGLIILFLLLLVITLGVFFCKQKQKVCFATHDVEKQSQTKGTERGTAQTGETEHLFGAQGDETGFKGTTPDKGVEDINLPQEHQSVENNESEHEDPVSTHLSSTRAELLDNKEENHQHRASMSRHSNEEDSGSFNSAIEEQNDPDLADVSDQSPEDEQFGLKADPEQSGSENNQGEQEEPGSAPASQRSGSSTEQDPDHESSDIYTSNPDPVKLQESPEKEVLQPESSDTEQGNKQGRDSMLKGSTDDDPKSHSSVSTGQNDPDSADVLGKSPEVKQAGLKPAPGQSDLETTPVCAEIKTGESKESSTSSEPAPSQDQGHHPDINKDESGADELKQAAQTGPSQQNPSDLMKAQDPADPAESTKNMNAPPSLGAESPVPQDSIHHANINDGDSNADQSKTPEKIRMKDTPNPTGSSNTRNTPEAQKSYCILS